MLNTLQEINLKLDGIKSDLTEISNVVKSSDDILAKLTI